jgi:hypothetical protein
LLPPAACTFCVGELNDQLVRLDFDPDDMSVDEDCIVDVSGCLEVPPNRFCDESFDLVSADAADGPGLPGSALQQCGGDVVVVPENPIRPDSRDEGESEHHPTRCVPSSICLERPSPTCSSRGAGLKSRTCFFGISSILP